MNFKKLTLFILAVALALPAQVSAGLFNNGGTVSQAIGSGEVNWTNKVIRASGSGAPDTNAPNIAVARLGAERAAKLDAMRNILETVKGVRVDSSTTIENYMSTSDFVRSNVNGSIRGARIVDKKYLSDGSVEVVIEVPMAGLLTESLIPQTGGLAVPSMGDQVYTGLIIDATGLGARPAMSPKILDEEGREVYGSSYVSREFAISQGIVGYARELSAAMENDRVAGNPLIIRGAKASGPGSSDIVIARADADALRDKSKNLSFLEQCRVIIIVD